MNYNLIKSIYHSLHLQIHRRKLSSRENIFLLLRMFLRSILTGKIYIPNFKQREHLFFTGTQNQFNALSNIRKEIFPLTWTYYHGNDVKVDDSSSSKFPFWMTFLAAIISYFAGRQLQYSIIPKLKLKNPYIQYRFNISLIIGQYYTVLLLLKIMKPKYIWLSNDHTPVNVAFLYASRKLGITSVYLQHASVSPLFPPLNFDYAFLDGSIAYNIYKDIGICGSRCTLSGISKMDGYINRFSDSKNKVKILICINQIDNIMLFNELIEKLLEVGFCVKIRKHPYFKSILKIEDKVEVSTESIFMDSLTEIDVLIAGDSNVHLEATLANIPCFYISTSRYFDYYGFLGHGMVLWGGRSVDECIQRIQEYRPIENVYLRAKPYCASVGTDHENKSTSYILDQLGIS